MGFFAIVVVFCLLAAAGYYGKPWVDRQLLLHRDHPKKREEENASSCDDGGVEIVVNESTDKREAGRAEDARKPTVPVASVLPARLARQQLESPLGPMEASIRTALRELRSRQVVKSICSKFESRMATAKAGLNGDERATTESGDDDCSARAVQYQPLLPRQEIAKTEEKPQPAVNMPAPRHSTGGAGPAQRSNNLNAFLRRYSSNLEKAVMVMQTAVSGESDGSQDTKRDRVSEEAEEVAATPATANASTPAQPVMMIPCDDDSDLDDDYDDLKLEETLNKEAESTSRMPAPLLNLRLDIEPIVAIPSDDSSNQCDSPDDDGDNDDGIGEDSDKKQDPVDPLEISKGSDNNDDGRLSPRSCLAKWTASRIPVPAAARSLSRSSFTSESGAQRKLQTPEKASKSVARLQQFRQQVPANAYAGARHLD